MPCYILLCLAVSEFVPGGRGRYRELMDESEFILYTVSGMTFWGNKKGKQDWSDLNSVEICQKVLSMINKKIILQKLNGEDEDGITTNNYTVFSNNKP